MVTHAFLLVFYVEMDLILKAFKLKANSSCRSSRKNAKYTQVTLPKFGIHFLKTHSDKNPVLGIFKMFS